MASKRRKVAFAGVIAAAVALVLIVPRVLDRPPSGSDQTTNERGRFLRAPGVAAVAPIDADEPSPPPSFGEGRSPSAVQKSFAEQVAKSPSRRESVRFEPVPADERPKTTVSSDTLLMHYAAGTSEAERRDAARDAGGRVVRTMSEIGVDVISVEPSSREKTKSRLESDERVEEVEHDHMRYIADSPDDELFFGQTPLFNSRLPAAWDVTHGSSTIDIAIVDTGVKLSHPDLASKIVPGTDIVNSDPLANDDHGHGTTVAGIAAAVNDNGIGIAGAAWNARIMPIKVLDSSGGGADSDIAAGVTWAADHDADVINLSLGGPDPSSTMESAVNYAIGKGAVVVVAAGNESGVSVSYPAAYPNAIAVGATDFYGDVVSFSNHGDYVDVVAEGFGVLSTCAFDCPIDDYGISTGTSISSPLVAGVAALVRAKNPSFTPAQIQARIKSTAIDRGPRGIDDYYGWGLVDAYAAVGGRTAAPPPAPVRTGDANDVAEDAVALGATGTSSISPEGDVDWFYRDAGSAGAVTLTVTPMVDDDGTFPQAFVPVITAWGPGYESMGRFKPAGCVEDPLGPSASCYGNPTTASIEVPAAGRYRFRVENMVSSRTNSLASLVDPYTLTSSFVAGAGGTALGAKAWVIDSAPVPFATGVAGSVSPTMTFARDLTPSSVTPSTVKLTDAKTGSVVASAAPAYNAGTKTVTIDPTAALIAGRTYVMSVTGVGDGSGTMTETFKASFTVTAPAPVRDLTADFNKDGFEDTVIGSPGEDNGTLTDGGVVHVLYGGASGPSAKGSQMWSQNSSGIAGSVEKGDRFGEAVATGDLNNDGYDDLVIGVPYEDIGSIKDAGAIHVLLGSASRLRSAGNQLWYQGSSGVPGSDETSDRFGLTLAIGNFDNSAGDDVAIGAPGEAIGSAAGAGAVTVLRGGAGGLVTTGAQQWTQNSVGIEATAQAGDGFGASLAAGDLQGDTHDDLAIGTPSDNLSADEGSVTLMRGSILGLRPITVTGDFFSADGPQSGDAFGSSVAITDMGGYASVDGYGDLIVGAAGQKLGSSAHAGRVNVTYNDHSDLPFFGEVVDQSSFGFGSIEAEARFGTTLHGKNLPGQGVLAVGSPLDNVGSVLDAGSVTVLQSSGVPNDFGLFTLTGERYIHQNSSGVPGGVETNDRFGHDVAVLDIDRDAFLDLVIGTPLEGVGSSSQAGATYSAMDVTAAAPVYTIFTQDTSGIASAVETGDKFGLSVD